MIPAVYSNLELRGRVQAISGQQITLRMTSCSFVVDLAEMIRDTNDEEAMAQLQVGDLLCVIGIYEEKLLVEDVIRAHTVVFLKKS